MASDMLEYFVWLSLTAAVLLLGWLAIVGLKRIRRGSRVRCPECAEWIQPQAHRCRFCGATFAQPAPPQAASSVSYIPPEPQAPPPAPRVQSEPATNLYPSPPPQPPAPPAAEPGTAFVAPQPPVQPTAPVVEPAAPTVLEPPTSVLQPAAAQTQQEQPVQPAPAQPWPVFTEAEQPAVAVQPAVAAPVVSEPEPERSPIAVGLEQMRHLPAEQHPAGFYEQVLSYLHDEDPRVREEAVRFLARHCRHHDDAEHLLEMVVTDPDVDVRDAAAECLGGVFRATRNREVNELLAGVARNPEEDGLVRRAAYIAIRKINGY